MQQNTQFIQPAKPTVLSPLPLEFCILFHFTNSLPIDLIMLAIWYWNEGFYFLLYTEAGFSIFYIGLLFTRTVARVNLNYELHAVSRLDMGEAAGL